MAFIGGESNGPKSQEPADEDTELAVDDPPSLLDQAFEGWELLSEAAGEIDSDLGSVMASGMSVARVAFEEQVDEFMGNLGAYLRETQLTPLFQQELIEELRHLLIGARSPFTLAAVDGAHQRALEVVAPSNRSPEQATRDLLIPLSDVIRRALRSDPDPWGPIPSNDSTAREWRILATLDRPQLLGREGSLYCAVPSRIRWRRKVKLEEATYQGIMQKSSSAGDIEAGDWIPFRATMFHETSMTTRPTDSTGPFKKIWLRAPTSCGLTLAATYSASLMISSRRMRLPLLSLRNSQSLSRRVLSRIWRWSQGPFWIPCRR